MLLIINFLNNFNQAGSFFLYLDRVNIYKSLRDLFQIYIIRKINLTALPREFIRFTFLSNNPKNDDCFKYLDLL